MTTALETLTGAQLASLPGFAPAVASIPTVAPKMSMPFFRGVNVAGMNRYIDSETEPSPAALRWIIKRGFNLVRLNLTWNSFQAPVGGLPSGPLNASYLAKVKRVVEYLTANGCWVTLDDHSSFRYKTTGQDSDSGAIVGQSAVTNAMAAAFWTRLANEFRSNGRVMFEPANEPHDMDQTKLAATYQAIITAIRATGALNPVVIDGNSYSAASTWEETNAATLYALADPASNLVYSPHQYLDRQGGTTSVCYVGEGPLNLVDATNSARTHGVKLLLGEFGGGNNSACYTALKETVDFVENNRDVWIGWAAFAVMAGQRSNDSPDDFFLAMDPDAYEGQSIDDARITNSFVPFLTDTYPTSAVTAAATTGFNSNGGTLTQTTGTNGTTPAAKLVIDSTNAEHALYSASIASVQGKKHTFQVDIAIDAGTPWVCLKIADTVSYVNYGYVIFDLTNKQCATVNTDGRGKFIAPTSSYRQMETNVHRLTISTIIEDTTSATSVQCVIAVIQQGTTAVANWTGDGVSTIRAYNATWKIQ